MDKPVLGAEIPEKHSKLSWLKDRKNQYIIIGVIFVIIVILLIIFLINRSSNNTTVSTQQSNAIVESYRAKIPELESKVELNPKDAAAVHELAVALYAIGDFEGAKEKYQMEASLNPNNAITLNNLGNSYRDTGDYAKAIDSYIKSIDLDKAQLNAYLNLANLYIYTTNQFELGIQTLENGIENNNNNAEVMYMQIAGAYLVKGQKDTAKQFYNQVIELNPNNTGAINALKNL